MLGASEQLVSKREQVPDVIKWLTEVIAKGYVIKFCDAELCVCVGGVSVRLCVSVCMYLSLCKFTPCNRESGLNRKTREGRD